MAQTTFTSLDTLIDRAYKDLVRRGVIPAQYIRGMRNMVNNQIKNIKRELNDLHKALNNVDASDNMVEFVNIQEEACDVLIYSLALCKLALVEQTDILKKMDFNETRRGRAYVPRNVKKC